MLPVKFTLVVCIVKIPFAAATYPTHGLPHVAWKCGNRLIFVLLRSLVVPSRTIEFLFVFVNLV